MYEQPSISESFVQEVIEKRFNNYHYKSKSVYVDTEMYTHDLKRADIFLLLKGKNLKFTHQLLRLNQEQRFLI